MKKQKTRLRLKRNVKVTLLSILVTSIMAGGIVGIKSLQTPPTTVVDAAKAEITEIKIEEIETTEPTTVAAPVVAPVEAEGTKKVEEKTAVENNSMQYRMTFYATDDGYGTGSVTASGKSTKDFQINENGWYTYQGKLVVATASTRLGKTNQKTYKLYDELEITIKGKKYDAIVLDACGACMKGKKIDLFVSSTKYGYDGQVTVVKK
jgi:hypothetical protein